MRCRKQQLPDASAILAAAGSGERLGAGEPKAFVELAGRRMLEWSLDALAAADLVGQVIVAVPAGYEGRIAAEGVATVAGGETRTESVANALALCEADLVAVHDAARPLATSTLFDRLIERVASDDSLAGAIAVSSIHDTVKRVDVDGSVVETIDRTVLRAAETPQVFRVSELREAIESAGAGHQATDEAMLVEAAGGSVATVESDQENFKVTTPADLERAATILSTRP